MPPRRRSVTGLEVRLAREVSEALAARGFTTTMAAATGPAVLQALEIAIDAMDIRQGPAVLAGGHRIRRRAGPSDLTAALLDPVGRGPAIWFQQMDEPRPQRNRIHLDVDVPHDAAQVTDRRGARRGRHAAHDRAAPAFWVLADPEGNEACVCTWQGRD